MSTTAIESERLSLVCMTPAFLSAALAGSLEQAARVLKIDVPPEWPGEDVDALELRLAQLQAEPALQPWLLRAMVLRGTGLMVGHIGFHTAPGAEYLRAFSPGAVEFGFTVFPPYRRRGYAREAAVALMDWARREHGVGKFILSIRPDNVASQALAAQLGFARIGSHVDEIDGLEEVLEYRVSEEAR